MNEIKYEELPIISTGPFGEIPEEIFDAIIRDENDRKWEIFRKELMKKLGGGNHA